MDEKEAKQTEEEEAPSPTLEQVDFWTLIMEQMGR